MLLILGDATGIIYFAEYLVLLFFASLIPSILVLFFFINLPKRKWFYLTHFLFWWGTDLIGFWKIYWHNNIESREVTLLSVFLWGFLYLFFKSLIYLLIQFKWSPIKTSAFLATFLIPFIGYAGLTLYTSYNSHSWLDEFESRPYFGNIIEHQGFLYLVHNKNSLCRLENGKCNTIATIPSGLLNPQIVSTGPDLYLLATEKIKHYQYYRGGLDEYIPRLFILKENRLEEILASPSLRPEPWVPWDTEANIHASNFELFITTEQGTSFLFQDRFFALEENGSKLGSPPVYYKKKWYTICPGLKDTLCEFQWDPQSTDKHNDVVKVETYESYEPMFLSSDSRIFVLKETQWTAFLDRVLRNEKYKGNFDHITQIEGSPEELYLLDSWGGGSKIIRLSSSKEYEVISPFKHDAYHEDDKITSIVWKEGALYAAFKQNGLFQFKDGNWTPVITEAPR